LLYQSLLLNFTATTPANKTVAAITPIRHPPMYLDIWSNLTCNMSVFLLIVCKEWLMSSSPIGCTEDSGVQLSWFTVSASSPGCGSLLWSTLKAAKFKPLVPGVADIAGILCRVHDVLKRGRSCRRQLLFFLKRTLSSSCYCTYSYFACELEAEKSHYI
jgi:hypothetical protein